MPHPICPGRALLGERTAVICAASGPEQRPGAADPRLSIRASSPGSLRPACWFFLNSIPASELPHTTRLARGRSKTLPTETTLFAA